MNASKSDGLGKTLNRWKLSLESIDVQVERRRKATLVLSAIAGTIGAVFLAIFLAFGNPWPGLVLNAVLVFPVIGWAWVEDFRLHRDVAKIAQNDTSGRDG